MKNALIGFILGLIVAGAVCAYNALSKITTPSILAQPAKELANAKTETIKCVPLIVYRDSKKPLNLPADVVKDPAKQVVGSTQVAASEYPHTVSAVANIESGQVHMFVRQDPAPFLSFTRPNALGAAYGLREDGKAVLRLDGAYGILSAKVLKLDAIGDVDNGGRGFVGFRLWF